MIFGFFASVNISIERFYSISLDKMLPAGQLHQGVFTISGTEKKQNKKNNIITFIVVSSMREGELITFSEIIMQFNLRMRIGI